MSADEGKKIHCRSKCECKMEKRQLGIPIRKMYKLYKCM